MKTAIEFLSLTAICAGLGMDNGLLVELSIRGLKLDEKAHMFWRTVALLCAAAMRVAMLAVIQSLTFLKNPLPESWLNLLGKLNPASEAPAHHGTPEPLTWMNFTFFIGGLIIIVMAFVEMYHKYRELRYRELHKNEGQEVDKSGPSKAEIVKVCLYLLVMNLIFSLDSVFTSVAMMNIDEHFVLMCTAVVGASIIMIVGMVPLGKLIAKSRHFSVTMLVVLVLIAAKLLVDGVGGHFPNSVLILLLVAIFGNDAIQSFYDKAAEAGEKEALASKGQTA